MQVTDSSYFSPSGNSFVGSLRELLKTYRRGGWLTINRAATLAGISVRTLQRRLTEEDWVFSELVDQVRIEIATEMLLETDVPLCDIAFHLGYSNQANFTRAFQRWTGETPARYRSRQIDQYAASPSFAGTVETDVIEPSAG